MINKTVLITGASSGIGLSTAKLFLEDGFTVLLSGRNEQTLVEVEQEINHPNIHIYQADVASMESLNLMFENIANDDHKINCLIVNAAIANPLPFEAVTESNFDMTMNVNFKGAFFTLQKSLSLLAKNATVVFVTSISNQMGSPNFSVYSGAKAALRSLVKTLGLELIEKGIRVNAVSPGPIETPMYSKFGLPDEMLDGIQESIKEKSPIKRFGQPEEVAKVIFFLSSEQSSYIVGDEIVVDGGMSLL